MDQQPVQSSVADRTSRRNIGGSRDNATISPLIMRHDVVAVADLRVRSLHALIECLNLRNAADAS